MATSTPHRSNPASSSHSADFTRPQEPQTPSNLNRTAKRQQRTLNVQPPPRLELGDNANTSTAARAIGGQLDAFEREAKIQRTVMFDFANAVDQFVASYKQQDQRTFAHEMCNRVVSFLTTSIYADTSNFVPLRVKSQPSGTNTTTSAPKSVSFAGMAKTLKNSGADFHSVSAPHSSHSGRIPTSNSGGASLVSSRRDSTTTSRDDRPRREDRRLLIPVEPSALLRRPEPFALRQELCASITGLTLAKIPTISPTRTGWSITPSDLTTRDLLTTQENMEIIMRVMHGKAVKRPELWYNYAVPGVPVSIHQLSVGTTTLTRETVTRELVAEEVFAQTQERPVDCRPSRLGANALTGKITWIASFLTPVRPFRLFNTSELSRLIDKKPQITRHDPGCQGFCNPAKCTRYARCNVCSTRIDQHVGPSGINCTGNPRCANCHGPFPAGHDHCPAAPKRKNGKIIRPTKKELDVIRRHGDRDFRDANTAPVDTAPVQDSQLQSQVQDPGTNVTKRKRGAVIAEYESAGLRGRSRGRSTTRPTTTTTTTIPSSQPSSSRPRRSTVTEKNLNLVGLSADSFIGAESDGPDELAQGMEIDNDSSC